MEIQTKTKNAEVEHGIGERNSELLDNEIGEASSTSGIPWSGPHF